MHPALTFYSLLKYYTQIQVVVVLIPFKLVRVTDPSEFINQVIVSSETVIGLIISLKQ